MKQNTLRVQTFFIRLFWFTVFIATLFLLGYICRITANFGTRKDERLIFLHQTTVLAPETSCSDYLIMFKFWWWHRHIME